MCCAVHTCVRLSAQDLLQVHGWLSALVIPFHRWGRWDRPKRRFVLSGIPSAWHHVSYGNLCKKDAPTRSWDLVTVKHPWLHYSLLELRLCGSSEEVLSREARAGSHCLYTPSKRRGVWSGSMALELQSSLKRYFVCMPSVFIQQTKTTTKNKQTKNHTQNK